MRKKKDFNISASMKSDAEEQILLLKKAIDYFITEYSVEFLVQKLNKGTIVIPEYQREFTWDDRRMSRFIESMLMELPIPFLFFWEGAETGKLEIVDGSQRLRTLQAFMNNEFRLGELERLDSLSHFKFSDLKESRQLKFGNRSIRGIVLNENADEEARLDLFDRINTGSKVANMAEIRRGALSGPFMDMVIELSKNDLFVSLTPVTDKKLKEREREELVSRFFAYGDGLEGYKDRVSKFIFDYIKKMNFAFNKNPDWKVDYESRFMSTMEFVAHHFPYGFRKSEKGNVAPRARFESIAIGSYLALRVNPDLHPDQRVVSSWIEDDDFVEITGSDGANAIGRLNGRINYIKNRLLGQENG